MKRDLTKLMKEIGAPSFNPLPPDQSEWQKDITLPPLIRLWSWLFHSTMTWGHDSPYAVDAAGHERHLEDAARDLGLDLANTYRAWRDMVARGIGRPGTKAEGKRRMYLCGTVKPAEAPEVPWSNGEEKANEIVCTDNLRPYILLQIKELPPEKQQEFWVGHHRLVKVEKAVRADLMAASRLIIDQDYDTHFQAFGIKKIREDRELRPPSEERQQRLDAILPQLKLFVQTISVSVQTRENEVYNGTKLSGETPVSLLQLEKGNKRPEPRSVDHLDTVSSPVQPQHPVDGKKFNQRYAPKTGSAISPLNETEKQALDSVLEKTLVLQRNFSHMDFSQELISAKSKNDRLFALRVVAAVGPANLDQFFQSVYKQLSNLDRNSLGKLPGRVPGPRSLGLILDWAVRYGDRLDEAARMEAIEQQRWTARVIVSCQEILADPRESSETKDLVRQRLADLGVETGRGAS